MLCVQNLTKMKKQMQVPFVDLSKTHKALEEELKQTFQQVLQASYFIYGPQVTAFEKQFSETLNTPYTLAVGNCTDALHAVLKMLNIKADDEVLVPALSRMTDAEVVSELGAKPIFVDVNEMGLMDVEIVENYITQKTKAIIPVHLYGQMVEMGELMLIAKKHGLFVIEDCAQAHLAKQSNQFAGTFGDAAVFSFSPTKNLGALGDAGAIVTSDKALYTACRKYVNHGASDKHSHEFPGANSRIDSLQAAILSLKLPYLTEWNEQRRQAANYYNTHFSKQLEIQLPKVGEKNEHVFHVYQIQTPQRTELKKFLKGEGIQTQVHYPKALPFTKAYSSLEHTEIDFPRAYRYQEQTLSIPLFPGISEAQQAHVVQCVNEYFS